MRAGERDMLRWSTGLVAMLRSIARRDRVEAELAALRAIGAIAHRQDESRDIRTAAIISDLRMDLRFAVRALRRSPAFAALAIGIMALGIGANTAVFSVVNAVLLRPLPYSDPDRIVTFSTVSSATGARIFPQVSMGDFRDWREQSASFDAMATYYAWEAPVSPGATAEHVRVARVNPDFFSVLDVTPSLGRTFVPEELARGNQSVVISHAYWQSRFGGDADVLQRTLRVYENTWPIVGILPPGFHFPADTQVWFPEAEMTNSRTGLNFRAIGRLRTGIAIEQAQAEMTTIATRLEQAYPQANKGRSVGLTRLQDEVVGNVRGTLYLVWGVVGMVLLIACANTATLLLGKATARTREIAVRTAIGASRRRLVQQLLTESMLLALVAAGVGMLLAYWGAGLLVALAPFDVVRSAAVGIEGRVLAFTLAVSLVTGVLFGMVPALHASRVDLAGAVNQGGTQAVTSARAGRTRGLLVASELALAVVLLTGAGLLLKSLLALHDVELGFQPENVLVMKTTGVRDIRENNAYFTEVMSRIAALPDVVAAGATSVPPGDLSQAGSGSYFIDRVPAERNRAAEAQTLMTIVAPRTFAALGIPVTRGRDFGEGDIVGRPMVAIVNEALVRRSFGDDDPIGRTIFCNFDRDDPMTIVGVVGDVRTRNPAAEPMPECYMPYRQHVYNNNTLYVVARTTGDPAALAGTVRRVASDVSPDVPVSLTTMEAMVADGVAAPGFRALLFGLFAALAVCLAMAGVYGVIAYSVEQRAKEIGLRIAIGASSASVLQRILTEGLILAAAGLTAGLAGAVAATRLLTTMLFDVQPLDAQVYLGVAVLLALVVLAASYVPGRRAARVNPVEVLKAN